MRFQSVSKANICLMMTIFVAMSACTHKSVKPPESIAAESSAESSDVTDTSLTLSDDASTSSQVTPEPLDNAMMANSKEIDPSSNFAAPVKAKRAHKKSHKSSAKKSRKLKVAKHKHSKKLKRAHKDGETVAGTVKSVILPPAPPAAPAFDAQQAQMNQVPAAAPEMVQPLQLAQPQEEQAAPPSNWSRAMGFGAGTLVLGAGLFLFRKRSQKKKSKRLVYA
jgi:hypothetical protein